MTFQFAPGVRDRVSLLISIGGVSGSGKTLSALKLARGLAGGDDSKIAFIDTEAGRGKHYSPAPGETQGPNRFAFQYGELLPPFTPERYREAIKVADDAGFEVIVIDSGSHIWEGEGGVHDMHDKIVDDQVAAARKNHNGSWEFDEARTRDRLSVGAWKTPKAEHKLFVQKLLQTRAHLILCLRADEKMRIEKVKDDRGREKTVIIQAKDLPAKERWSPICEKRLPYEMTISFVLSPEKPGFPVPIKLQDQHREAIPLDMPLSEESGRKLAEWARGGKPAAKPAPQDDDETDSERIARLDSGLAVAAKAGMAALVAAWGEIDKADKSILKVALDKRHKATAEAADASAHTSAERQP